MTDAPRDFGFPNYLTVDPDGAVGGVFPGGVIIPAHTGFDNAIDKAVVWTRGQGGAAVAAVQGIENAGNQGVQAVATDPDDATKYAFINVQTKDGLARAASYVGAYSGGAGLNRKIIDHTGVSDFLQLQTTAKRKLSFGVETVAGASDSAPIAHGLGVVPAAILATPVNVGGGVSSNTYIVINQDATDFQIHNFGTVNGFYWAAIG